MFQFFERHRSSCTLIMQTKFTTYCLFLVSLSLFLSFYTYVCIHSKYTGREFIYHDLTVSFCLFLYACVCNEMQECKAIFSALMLFFHYILLLLLLLLLLVLLPLKCVIFYCDATKKKINCCWRYWSHAYSIELPCAGLLPHRQNHRHLSKYTFCKSMR